MTDPPPHTHLWRSRGPGLGPRGRSPGPPRTPLCSHGICSRRISQPGQPGSDARLQTTTEPQLAKLKYLNRKAHVKRVARLHNRLSSSRIYCSSQIKRVFHATINPSRQGNGYIIYIYRNSYDATTSVIQIPSWNLINLYSQYIFIRKFT